MAPTLCIVFRALATPDYLLGAAPRQYRGDEAFPILRLCRFEAQESVRAAVLGERNVSCPGWLMKRREGMARVPLAEEASALQLLLFWP